MKLKRRLLASVTMVCLLVASLSVSFYASNGTETEEIKIHKLTDYSAYEEGTMFHTFPGFAVTANNFDPRIHDGKLVYKTAADGSGGTSTACYWSMNQEGTPIDNAVLQKADSIGVYIKNDSVNAIPVLYFYVWTEDGGDNGISGMKYQLIDMDGKEVESAGVSIPAGFEGYALCSFDYVQSFAAVGTPVDKATVKINKLGIYMNGTTLGATESITFGDFFLAGDYDTCLFEPSTPANALENLYVRILTNYGAYGNGKMFHEFYGFGATANNFDPRVQDGKLVYKTNADGSGGTSTFCWWALDKDITSIDNAVLQKADSIGVYVKNDSVNAIPTLYFTIMNEAAGGDNAIPGMKYKLIDMDGKEVESAGVSIPAGFEGYVLCSFDYVQSYADVGTPVDKATVKINKLGIYMDGTTLGTTESITFGDFFLAGDYEEKIGEATPPQAETETKDDAPEAAEDYKLVTLALSDYTQLKDGTSTAKLPGRWDANPANDVVGSVQQGKIVLTEGTTFQAVWLIDCKRGTPVAKDTLVKADGIAAYFENNTSSPQAVNLLTTGSAYCMNSAANIYAISVDGTKIKLDKDEAGYYLVPVGFKGHLLFNFDYAFDYWSGKVLDRENQADPISCAGVTLHSCEFGEGETIVIGDYYAYGAAFAETGDNTSSTPDDPTYTPDDPTPAPDNTSSTPDADNTQTGVGTLWLTIALAGVLVSGTVLLVIKKVNREDLN